MKKPLPVILLLILSLPFTSLSQAPHVEWQRVLGNENGDYPSTILQTKDGGYIVAGYREGRITQIANNSFHEDNFLWVIKFDASGKVQWENHVMEGTLLMPDIVQTPDGGYMVVTAAWIRGCNVLQTNVDIYAIKLSATGEVEWKNNYGGSANEHAYAAGITPDNGFIIAGGTESNNGDVSGNHGQRDFWIIKINAAGNLVWQKTLGGTQDDEAFSLAIAPDGGCVVGGRTSSNNGDVTGNHGNTDAWIVKLSPAGTLEWQKCLGGSMSEVANAITRSNNNGFVVAVTSNSNDGNVSGLHNSFGDFSDYWIVDLSASGNINWSKCYGGQLNEEPFDIQPTADGAYVITGSAQSSNGDLTCNKGYEDIWLIKINAAGTLQWQKSFGGSLYDIGFSIQSLPDHSYIMAAQTCSKEIAGYHKIIPGNMGSCSDFYILKLTAEDIPASPSTVKIDPASAQICAGSPATLFASAMHTEANTVFSWQKNGAPVGENSPYYTSSDLKANDVVKCMIVSDGSCENGTQTASDMVVIKNKAITLKPELTIQSSSEILCNCKEVRFEATVKNRGSDAVFTWKINGKSYWNNRNVFVTDQLKNGDIVTCEYTDASVCITNGSIISNSIQIASGNAVAPAVSISTPSPVVCTGTAVVLKAKAVNGGIKPFYQWKINGQNSGINADSLVVTSPANGDRISCIISVDPQFTCSSSASASSKDIILQVKSGVNPSVTIRPSSTNICKGEQVTITLDAHNAGSAPTYKWLLNDEQVNETSSVFKSNSLTNDDEIYGILLPGSDVCETEALPTDRIKFYVHDVPVIKLTPADTTVKRGTQVHLVTSVNGSYSSFNWTPEAVLTNAASLQTSTVPLRESVELKLTVVNEEGCRVEAISKINIRSALFMPNAFTPNGDGRNDVFRIPEGTALILNEFSVFDRWGNKVFSTNDINQVWNGTCNGNPGSAGIYVYFITGTGDKGKLMQKGTVALIR